MASNRIIGAAMAVATPLCVVPALVGGAGLMILNAVTLNLTPLGGAGVKGLTFVGNSLVVEADAIYTLATNKRWPAYDYDEEFGGLFAKHSTQKIANFVTSISCGEFFLNPKRLIVARVAALGGLVFCIFPRALEAAATVPLAAASLTMHAVKFVADKCFQSKETKYKIDYYTSRVDVAFRGALQFPKIVVDIAYFGTKLLFA